MRAEVVQLSSVELAAAAEPGAENRDFKEGGNGAPDKEQC